MVEPPGPAIPQVSPGAGRYPAVLWLSVAATSGLAVGLVAHRHRLTSALSHQQQLRDDLRHWEHQATHDPLTGLLNRAALLACIEQRLATNPRLAVLFCDVDRFKAVNDGFGHDAGDLLIGEIARRLENLTDGTMAVARLGGDEFVIVLDADRADIVSRAIVGSMRSPCPVGDRTIRVSISVGVAIGPWTPSSSSPSTSPAEVLALADSALREAKRLGGDRIETMSAGERLEHDRIVRRETLLRRAIADSRTIPYFQPEFDVGNRRLIGAEVLARWTADDGSLIGAGEYLESVVDAHSYERLTESAVRGATPLIDVVLSSPFADGFRFRVNLPQHCAPRAWRDDRIVALFGPASLEWLTIDLCTTAVTDDLRAAAESLADLRSRGARVSLADVPHADLRILDSIAIDEVRIDGRVIGSDRPSDRLHLDTARRVSDQFGAILSAVCVERPEQSRELLALGCVHQQGRLFHHEATAHEFERLLLVGAPSHSFDRQMA
ncbi:MAG: diguanylate cyclase [Actinobacteria bacterium]|nr:diguanylate cyclase [Actinomycetota bacterium]